MQFTEVFFYFSLISSGISKHTESFQICRCNQYLILFIISSSWNIQAKRGLVSVKCVFSGLRLYKNRLTEGSK
jgi:hypothetical protein